MRSSVAQRVFTHDMAAGRHPNMLRNSLFLFRKSIVLQVCRPRQTPHERAKRRQHGQVYKQLDGKVAKQQGHPVHARSRKRATEKSQDRKHAAKGKSAYVRVDLGGRRILKKKKKHKK